MSEASVPPAAPAPVPRRTTLPAALTVLTVVSGIVDAVSYLGLGRVFAANMTGNVVIIGFAAAGAPGFSVLGSLTSLGAFLAGAVCAGRLTAVFAGRARQTWVRSVFVSEAVLLAAATAVAFAWPGEATYALIAVLAWAMGLRNATVRKLAVPDMTTTVLTMTLTGLASESSLAGGTDPRPGRGITSVVAMLAGAGLGALLVLHHGLGWPLLVGTLLVAVAAAGYREPAADGDDIRSA
ncbi:MULTISPECIES: YoaK family protein [unclassified Streptomyces]|uniref:YoaK family protein n=1 Tax=unclassified Streptomyces TaxID=2593676 RepID=UPI0036EB5B39